jgi:4-amino-4-deoxy-L-arabinose transferase-like glycosyltransferase
LPVLLKKLLSKEKLTTWFLLLLLMLPRILFLTNSTAEYHGWRQSDTETIAYRFLVSRFNLFYPQLNYDGPLPNYVQLELQLTPFLVALLYKYLGIHMVWARLVPLAFFFGSAGFLFGTAQRLYDARTAQLAVLLYGLYPLNIFISRAVMPESAALFFYLGSLYYLLRWSADGKYTLYLLSALFLALAIMEKIPAALMLLPLLCLVYRHYYALWGKNNYPVGLSVALYLSLGLGIPLAYYLFAHRVAETAFVSGIALQQILPNFARALFTRSFWLFFANALPCSFSAAGLFLLVPGLLFLHPDHEPVTVSWTLGAALELIFIAGVIQLDYYLVFAGPLFALLGGRTLSKIMEGERKVILPYGRHWHCCCLLKTVLVILLAGLVFVQAWLEFPIFYTQNTALLQQVEAVQRYTRPGDLVVIGSEDPELLNLSRRVGWRANIFFPGQPEKEIAFFREKGAQYFIPVGGTVSGTAGAAYLYYLETSFPNISAEPSCPVYWLQYSPP